ncbi:2-hydroxychromene-2-carboxylate isomerase [Roseateles amylovorans]|uniref:2-hydroxychromene-2-carboxylate isomerase n=1 Tax=Roseateles amylovorans TaxID=2978473 RepID=A0ABY6BA52_9BURK|nr:2-hydroxychromene-2-carboxylate isomerase [Roseateles amylovorans]UXH80450.1 2-hydroxychromene-2-carboxylate isomerase [Roseateles amylovorans]
MKTLDFYFDPISPYAALAFERLPEMLAGRSVAVRYVPILFGALLKANDHKGPAEIPGKRDWTYRQVLWLSHQLGLPLALPASHPFNPLPLLRLLWACAEPGQDAQGRALTPSRFAVERVLTHVWRGGQEATDAARLQALATELAPAQDPASDAVKAALRGATDEAQARGVFGVPTLAVDDKLFWGLDALEMAVACLDGDPWFEGPAWSLATAVPVGIRRQ